MQDQWILVGRSSSHYTRLVRIVAAELGVSYRLEPVHDLMTEASETFSGNPALKLPVLRRGQVTVFGSMNICRILAREANAESSLFWPEEARSLSLMNAHEVLAHAMAAQVDVVIHELIAKRPEDHASRKRRRSLANCLHWLDENLESLRSELPGDRLSLFEVGLFCLIAHLPFRNSVDLSGMHALLDFGRSFGERPSAQSTQYRYDRP